MPDVVCSRSDLAMDTPNYMVMSQPIGRNPQSAVQDSPCPPLSGAGYGGNLGEAAAPGLQQRRIIGVNIPETEHYEGTTNVNCGSCIQAYSSRCSAWFGKCNYMIAALFEFM